MQALLKGLLKDDSIKNMAARYGKGKGQAFVYGLAGTQKHAAFAACYQ